MLRSGCSLGFGRCDRIRFGWGADNAHFSGLQFQNTRDKLRFAERAKLWRLVTSDLPSSTLWLPRSALSRHLLDLGHRRIGLIAGPSYASSSRGRVEGYRRAMAEAGVDPDPALVVESSFGIDSGVEAAEALMRLSPPPTALFAVNDNTAVGALSALGRLGLSVPGDVSLVGYNDIPIVSRLPTPLTSVRVSFDQIASAALDLLTHGSVNDADRVRIATPSLIPRRSTAAPPGLS